MSPTNQRRQTLVRFATVLILLAAAPAAGGFVNFESPHVHPIDLSPDGEILAVVNTAAHRLLLFDVTARKPRPLGAVTVGLDPVSVRFRTNREAWVVNQISDSVSVVDVKALAVRATLPTADEPADVVFAGAPERGFVSCSQADQVLVFDPADLDRKARVIEILGEDPRSMAVSPDGETVYVGIFESGNRTTILSGGFDPVEEPFLPTLPGNVVSDPRGPYGGQNPPPNKGTRFEPPIAADLPSPPPVALILKRHAGGRWMDDNGGDWTDFISGPFAGTGQRVPGWDVLDNDLAMIDARTNKVRYVRGLMNLVMAVGVNPVTAQVTAVGTDATNEIRYEPNLNGTFLRVNVALAGPRGGGKKVLDLNPHLDYRAPRVDKARRNLSVGDPRAVVWSADGERGYVAGMGSNNLVVIDGEGRRAAGAPIEVGQGPTGLALDSERDRLFVLNRFSASIDVIDLATERRFERVRFKDPTPGTIKRGRRHLFDTHATSGLGHVSCASCHVDARTDRLAWELGDPTGAMISQQGRNRSLIRGDFFEDAWHPMKGPMTTQTLQDIIGKEPHHWRGDRKGLEEFAGAFQSLLGDDRPLPPAKMSQFERYLATIYFPPNPYRELDNSLPERVSLEGHTRTGRFGGRGEPMPDGNAVRGLALFRFRENPDPISPIICSDCHTFPTGVGTNAMRNGDVFQDQPPGPNGESNVALIGRDGGSIQRGIKVPQLRGLYDKVGMDYTQPVSRAGFGFNHDGTIDSLSRFVGNEGFGDFTEQEVADVIAFLLAFSGSGFDHEPTLREPPGLPSQDAHAAVGRQVTTAAVADQERMIDRMIDVARTREVALVVKGRRGKKEKGWIFDAGNETFSRARGSGGELTREQLAALAGPGSELTWTVVPTGVAKSFADRLRANRSGARKKPRPRPAERPQ